MISYETSFSVSGSLQYDYKLGIPPVDIKLGGLKWTQKSKTIYDLKITGQLEYEKTIMSATYYSPSGLFL